MEDLLILAAATSIISTILPITSADLHSSGYTQSTCSHGGGPCEGFEKRWRTTTSSDRGV